MVQSLDFIVKVCFFIERHPRKHRTPSFLFYPSNMTWQCEPAVPHKTRRTPAPLRLSVAGERCVVWQKLASRSGRLSVTRARGSGAARTPFLHYGVTNPLTIHQNTLTVLVSHLPLNLRSLGGSRMRICSSLDMFLAGKVTLGFGEQLRAASTESLSRARERAARSRLLSFDFFF